MHELVYADASVERLILAKFPSAKIEDASDFIHTDRFELELEDSLKKSFYVFAIREGFALCCFGLQLMLRGRGKEALAELKVWTDIGNGEG